MHSATLPPPSPTTMEPPPAAQTLNLCGHFFAMTVLFLLLPLSSLLIFPTASTSTSTSTSDHHHLLIPFLYIASLLYFCTLATIIYSTFCTFIGRPVKFLSAFKSFLYSALAMISTTIAAQLCVLFIFLLPVVFFVVFIKGVEILGFVIDNNSFGINALYIFLWIVLASIYVYVQVIWVLKPVVVVEGSKLGLETLRRSPKLIKGMEMISPPSLTFFGNLTLLFVWMNLNEMLSTSSIEGRSWAFVLQIVLGFSFGILLLIHNVASFTLLHTHCKTFPDKLAFEIAEESAREYVSLPCEVEKVSHAVTVVV